MITGILIMNALVNVYGQTREELETRKKKNESEIEYATKLLDEAKKTRRSTGHRIRLIERRIQLRDQLIKTIEEETGILEEEIREKERIVEVMEKDLKKLRDEYGKLIYYSYKNMKSYDRIIFILSSENFNQAYRRMKYLQEYSQLRKKQARMIGEVKNELTGHIGELIGHKKEKEKLIIQKRKEKEILRSEKQEKIASVGEIRKQEKRLKNEIKRKEQINRKLEEEIERIIAEETRKAKEMSIYERLTPAEKALSDNFRDNKGKLPWPTERGIITGKFGKQNHPVVREIIIENNGIDISTVEGEKARALFEGTVTRVFGILGANSTVIIRHGNFLTVYHNLVDVRVKKGDHVRTKQILGTVYTEKKENATVLHVEIWEEMQKLDPEKWLSSK